MTITTCPMCRIGLPNGGTGIINTCEGCGADLRRFIAKPPKLPPPEALEEAKPTRNRQMEAGILGAAGGAVAGAVLMFGFYLLTSFKFPLFGTGIGAITGFAAKKFYQATDNRLAAISAVLAGLSVTGTLYLMYREFSILFVTSVVFAAAWAYRIVSD